MNAYFRLAHCVRQLGGSWEAWNVSRDLGKPSQLDYEMALTHALDAQSMLQKCIDELRTKEESRPNKEFIEKAAIAPLT